MAGADFSAATGATAVRVAQVATVADGQGRSGRSGWRRLTTGPTRVRRQGRGRWGRCRGRGRVRRYGPRRRRGIGGVGARGSHGRAGSSGSRPFGRGGDRAPAAPAGRGYWRQQRGREPLQNGWRRQGRSAAPAGPMDSGGSGRYRRERQAWVTMLLFVGNPGLAGESGRAVPAEMLQRFAGSRGGDGMPTRATAVQEVQAATPRNQWAGRSRWGSWFRPTRSPVTAETAAAVVEQAQAGPAAPRVVGTHQPDGGEQRRRRRSQCSGASSASGAQGAGMQLRRDGAAGALGAAATSGGDGGRAALGSPVEWRNGGDGLGRQRCREVPVGRHQWRSRPGKGRGRRGQAVAALDVGRGGSQWQWRGRQDRQCKGGNGGRGGKGRRCASSKPAVAAGGGGNLSTDADGGDGGDGGNGGSLGSGGAGGKGGAAGQGGTAGRTGHPARHSLRRCRLGSAACRLTPSRPLPARPIRRR